MYMDLQGVKNGQDKIEDAKLSWRIYTTRYVNLL